MSLAAGNGDFEAEDSVSKATLRRFSKPKPYERWAEFVAVLAGLLVLWPFILIWVLFKLRPDLNNSPSVMLFMFPMMFLCAYTVRTLTQFSSWCRRAIVRIGVQNSFRKSGRSISGDFVGISYSGRILNLFRGVDWDFGFLELQPEGLRFEGERSSFLLGHDCVEETELKQYKLSNEGWFVRLFVKWVGEQGTPECFSVCFQDSGMPKPARNPVAEKWKRKIDDWRWNYMGTQPTALPTFPVESNPVDSSLARKSGGSRPYPRAVAVCALATTLVLSAILVVALLFFSIDWAGGVAAAIIFCGPKLFIPLYAWVFSKKKGSR